jgi:hypothetical protein
MKPVSVTRDVFGKQLRSVLFTLSDKSVVTISICKAVPDLNVAMAADIVSKQVDTQAELTSDDSTNYKKLGTSVKSHTT